MIFGNCTSMNSRGPTDVGFDQADYLKKIGLDYMELPAAPLIRYDDSRFEMFKKRMTESPLPCLSCNNLLDPSIRLTGKEYNQDVFENYVKKVMERVSSIGAKKVVFGSARARNIPSGMSHEDGMKQIVDRIDFMAKIADKHGVEIEIEHLNRIESNCINTFEESVSIAKRLNRPNIKSIFDYYHFAVSGEKEELIRENDKWIGHIHFACTLERQMPDLDDAKKLEPVFNILRDCSYNSTFTFEAYFPNREMDNTYFAEPISYIRNILNPPNKT